MNAGDRELVALIAASSPSYDGLVLSHAEAILQRLKDAGYAVVKLDDPAVVERVARAGWEAHYGGYWMDSNDEWTKFPHWEDATGSDRAASLKSMTAALAALVPEAKETTNG